MSNITLKTINIAQLKTGMYVNKIVKQSGKLTVKNHGAVKNDDMLKLLKNKGILEVEIDLNKSFNPEPEPTSQVTNKKDKPAKTVNFQKELHRAAQLHQEGKKIQHSMLTSIAEGLPVDVKVPKEFTENLVGSIDRNPNALMCLSKIREKDSYLMEHSLNVAILLANFAKFLSLPKEEVEELSLTGFLHDIGKINVPDNILHKPSKLTPPEMVIMKNHVVWGVKTLQQMDIPKRIIRTMAEHHERLDGKGYPRGTEGNKISKFGRMIAIVDSYDAITADRCYKKGMPSQKALAILMKDAPSQYDQGLVQQFIKCIGVYPVGSLVKLSNQQIALVISHNEKKPLMPVVKVFYSLRSKIFITPKDVNLSVPDIGFSIESTVLASDFGIDFNKFFTEKIAI